MSTIINGTSSAITFPDSTVQNTAATNYSAGGNITGNLNVSGSLGVGTTSPDANLVVQTTANTEIRISTSQNSVGQTNTLRFSSTASAGAYADGGAYIQSIQGSGVDNYSLAFGTPLNSATPTERMRIDNSGNLLVQTTNTSATAGVGFKVLGGAAVCNVMSESTNAQLSYRVYSTGASAYRFYVGLGGTVYATATTITGISDQRVKENIVDLDDGLNSVMALKPRKFDWKAGKGRGIKGDRGFIAQEFEQVFPDMIEEWADPAPEGEEPYKAVNANLIPTLVKAIQEQQAMIEELNAKVVALEAK